MDSNPSGANIEVNGKFSGKTPVSISYIETGQFRIRIQKEGFEVIDTKFKVRKKWFNYPVIDFFAEAIPVHWSSKTKVHFELKKEIMIEPKDLRLKANKILQKSE